MLSITIHRPVWKDRSVSVRKDLINLAVKRGEALQVKIEARPYDQATYWIDPHKALSIGKSWFVRGTELVNFPISEMEILNGAGDVAEN
mgnify:CR=1 FL=1